jgi:uncharacterized protein (DUF983 family)
MRYDEKPIYRRLIVPWFDSEAACFFVIFFMGVVIWFSLLGIYVTYEKIEFHRYIWVPVLLILMSTWVLISTFIRLIKRYKHRSSKYFDSKT